MKDGGTLHYCSNHLSMFKGSAISNWLEVEYIRALNEKRQDLRNQLSRKNVCSFGVELCFLAQVADINIEGNMKFIYVINFALQMKKITKIINLPCRM